MIVAVSRSNGKVKIVISGSVYWGDRVEIYEDGRLMYTENDVPKLLVYDAKKVRLYTKSDVLEVHVRLE